MQAVTQLIARLSILCYLIVASIASAHAFPMPRAAENSSAAGSNGATKVMDIGSSDSLSSNLEETTSMGEMQPNCHQSKTASSDVSSMSLCKIFCSATGHALTTDIFVDLASIAPPVQVASVSDDFRTRQLGVEQHPPK